MRVDVRDDLQVARSAFRPNEVHFGAIKKYRSSEAVRVDIIVWDEAFDPPRLAVAAT